MNMVKNQLTGDYGPVPDTARYYKVMASGFHTEGGGPWNPPENLKICIVSYSKQNFILMHDAVAVPHKLPSPNPHQKILGIAHH